MDLNDLHVRLDEAVRALRNALAACEELARRAAGDAARPHATGREAVRDVLLPEVERAKRRGR